MLGPHFYCGILFSFGHGLPPLCGRRAVLDGNDLAADGLQLGANADGSTIRGLVIRDFGGDGIDIQAGSNGNTIVGNYLGRLTVGGADAGVGEGNSTSGLRVLGANNTIGGTTTADRNVIAGNAANAGLVITGASATNNIVRGNYIGLGPTAQRASATTTTVFMSHRIQVPKSSAATLQRQPISSAAMRVEASGSTPQPTTSCREI